MWSLSQLEISLLAEYQKKLWKISKETQKRSKPADYSLKMPTLNKSAIRLIKWSSHSMMPY